MAGRAFEATGVQGGGGGGGGGRDGAVSSSGVSPLRVRAQAQAAEAAATTGRARDPVRVRDAWASRFSAAMAHGAAAGAPPPPQQQQQRHALYQLDIEGCSRAHEAAAAGAVVVMQVVSLMEKKKEAGGGGGGGGGAVASAVGVPRAVSLSELLSTQRPSFFFAVPAGAEAALSLALVRPLAVDGLCAGGHAVEGWGYQVLPRAAGGSAGGGGGVLAAEKKMRLCHGSPAALTLLPLEAVRKALVPVSSPAELWVSFRVSQHLFPAAPGRVEEVAARLLPLRVEALRTPPPGLALCSASGAAPSASDLRAVPLARSLREVSADEAAWADEHRFAFSLSDVSVVLGGGGGGGGVGGSLDGVRRRLAAQWGVRSVKVVSLFVEAFAHGGPTALVDAARTAATATLELRRDSTDRPGRYRAVVAGGGGGAAAAALRYTLPLHPDAAVVLQVVGVFEVEQAAPQAQPQQQQQQQQPPVRRRVVLGLHPVLPAAEHGFLTTDGRAVSRAHTLRGPLQTVGGDFVSEAVAEHVGSGGGGGFGGPGAASSVASSDLGAGGGDGALSCGVLRLEYTAEVALAPHSRRVHAARVACAAERKAERRRARRRRREEKEAAAAEARRRRQLEKEQRREPSRQRRRRSPATREGPGGDSRHALATTMPPTPQEAAAMLLRKDGGGGADGLRPSAPVRSLLPSDLRDDRYPHKEYCNGTCGGKCNFDAPAGTPAGALASAAAAAEEAAARAAAAAARVVSVEDLPTPLYLLSPHLVVQPADHAALAAFGFASQQPPPEAADAGPGPHRASAFTFEFRALLAPVDDCPSRLFFRYTFRAVGAVRTTTGAVNHHRRTDQHHPHGVGGGGGSSGDLTSDGGSPVHVLRGPSAAAAGGGNGVRNTFTVDPADRGGAAAEDDDAAAAAAAAATAAEARALDQYLQHDAVVVDVFDADTHFQWGTFEVPLHPLRRLPHERARHAVGEAAVVDAHPLEVERTTPDVTRAHCSRAPAVKAVVLYHLRNDAVATAADAAAAAAADEAAAAAAAQRRRGRHRVVAKRIVGLTEALAPTAGAAASPPPPPHRGAARDAGSPLAKQAPPAAAAVAPPAASGAVEEQLYFRCEEVDTPLHEGWRLATTAECSAHLQAAARAMDQVAGAWATCRVADGTVRGRGHGCLITRDASPPPADGAVVVAAAVTTAKQHPECLYRVVTHAGPLAERDRKMLGETEREALRRARADYVKDGLLRGMADRVKASTGGTTTAPGRGVASVAAAAAAAAAGKTKKPPLPPPTEGRAAYHELEERLEAVSRLRVHGKQKEAMLQAQLAAAMTKRVAVCVEPGCAALVELEVRNPFGVGYTFTVEVRDEPPPGGWESVGGDEEVTVVTSPAVWRALCARQGLPAPTTAGGGRLLQDHDARVFVGGEVPVPADASIRLPLQVLTFDERVRRRTVAVYIRDGDGTPRAAYLLRLTDGGRGGGGGGGNGDGGGATVQREITLTGLPNETLRRWIPVGLAEDLAEEHSHSAVVGASSRLFPPMYAGGGGGGGSGSRHAQGVRKKLKHVRVTRPGCGLMSFVDWQTTPEGHVLATETLQIEAVFPRKGGEGDGGGGDGGDGGGAACVNPSVTFLVFFYADAECMVPCQAWRVTLRAATEISGLRRTIGESSLVHVPVAAAAADGRLRGRLRLGVGGGVLGARAGEGDWVFAPAKTVLCGLQGFALRVRPTDGVVRRLRVNAVAVDEGHSSGGGSSSSHLHEAFALLLQGAERSGAAANAVTVTRVTLTPGEPHAFRWSISHVNTFAEAHTFRAVYSPHGAFRVEPREVRLEAQQSRIFTITFKPQVAGRHDFSLWVNDEDDVTVAYAAAIFYFFIFHFHFHFFEHTHTQPDTPHLRGCVFVRPRKP